MRMDTHYVRELKRLSGITVSAGECIAYGDVRAKEEREKMREAVDCLRKAAVLYCRWFDHGEPPVRAGVVAYEVYSSVCQALDHLKPPAGGE
jgi:hypothetical protein